MSSIKVDYSEQSLSKRQKEIAELEDLLKLYQDGTLPHDENDIAVIEDKIAFHKAAEEEMYKYLLAPNRRKAFFFFVKIGLFLLSIKEFFTRKKSE